MSDLIDDGTSPWGDQVSLSNHNSSSSSLALNSQDQEQERKQQQQQHEDIMSATTVLSGNAESSTNSPPKSMSQSTPALSSPRRTSRALKGRKGKLAKTVQVEQEESIGPLGPLGPLGDDTNDNEDTQVTPKASKSNLQPDLPENNNNNDASTKNSNDTMHDVPLNNTDIERGMESLRLSKEDHDAVLKKENEEKAKDNFTISVGDPIKVGDITSAHTVYTVHTNTTSKNYSKPEFSVTRRYRDFRWIYHALEHNNPGYIIPPPPEKQAMGRFNEDFVEARRAALETMLNKIGSHPELQKDGDFQLFLESEHFANESKHKNMNIDDDHYNHQSSSNSKGFMSSIGGAFSFSSKYVETSDWFIEKKNYLDNLESQLKSLAKSLDIVVTQRRELAESVGELGNALESVSSVEISRSLTELLENFSTAQSRIRDLYNRQCMQDVLSLATTLDEYIRIISSIRSVFLQRQKAFSNVQSAEQELNKKRQSLDKLHRQGRTLQDKIHQLSTEVDDQEKRVGDLRTVFEDISKTIMKEFDRFEHGKIRDFRNSVELFLENAIESQKEAIEIWETFYKLAGFGGGKGVPVTEQQQGSQPQTVQPVTSPQSPE